MLKKSFIFFFAVFLLQLMNSCLFRCPDPGTFENIYYGVTITAFNTAGFYPVEVVDSVYKNAFGLTVSVNFETKQIAATKPRLIPEFKSAYAFSCEEDTYLYPDPIKNLEIYAINPDHSEKINATSWFSIYGYNSDLLGLEEFMKIRELWHDGFQIELSDYQSVPSDVVFEAEVQLESGTTFTNQTTLIHFKNPVK
ncbi:MAG: hypothetical protein CVU09_04490 [Bacteroidetes bacterium HGW-Bacteroidetes-4]|jgi:hypothetical protein|nr:MAG: hypothetical protein CVU09_04490 [Bacteroidetes bacterium HGW-Bacteroidetes-4]